MPKCNGDISNTTHSSSAQGASGKRRWKEFPDSQNCSAERMDICIARGGQKRALGALELGYRMQILSKSPQSLDL